MEQKTFVSHPIYDKWEASRDGIIRNKRLKKNVGRITNMGYMKIRVYKNGKGKMYFSHRFIAECFYGPIPSGFIIDHINRDKLDNRIENLRLVTQSENCLNSAPKIKSQPRRPVLGIMDVQELPFSSMCAAGKYYDIHYTSVKYVAEGITQSAYSKKFSCRVSFIYV